MDGFHLSPYTATAENEFLGSAYQAQSAACKQEQMWRMLVTDRERQSYFFRDEFDTSFASDFQTSFQFVSDTMPANRFKKTHPVGVVTKVRVRITDKSRGYTGFFATGSKYGIMRISEFAATDPSF